ncbi:MAG: hypothetical protein K6B28_09115 [Lachnospiraceae bacterium]|nr:hypothetical protein [Lachnospiraceae bacterium]
MDNKRKKYKPVRQSNTIFAIITGVFFGIGTTLNVIGEEYPYIIIPFAWVICALPLVYCLSYSNKLEAFKANGICIPGHIIGAYEQHPGRGPSIYYLKIAFFEDGDKVLCTQGYYKDPNFILADTKCNVYKWKGKYLEADFNTICIGEKPKNLKIYAGSTGPFFSFKIGKVTDRKNTL